ncbi:MAG: HEAT repeat domain-containing protein [Sandaracinaceae bacterium]|nr:HEAT repeat domain-containing protein [Sandaracinaceae bacterium]
MIQGSRSRRRTTRLLLLAAAAAVLAVAATAVADARTDYLVRALRTSPMFRVRTQAAISLGGVTTEPQVTRALSDALSDDHPAVRAAACAALQRQGDPSALPALRRVTSDREAAVRQACTSAVSGLERVARTQPQSTRLPENNGGGSTPSGSARYYVAVGPVATKARGIDRGTLDAARQTVRSTAQGISGVRMAPDSESPRAATAVLQSDSLSGYYLDVSITSVEQTGQGLRAAVSVVVQSYPDRNIRSMLSGAATVPGGSGPTAERQAIEGALRGALRNLPQAMAASATASAPSGGGRRRR